ncbi:hypothetical protein ACFQY4_16125 [Catellatospora bangladeshensis]|uniref:Uncharacterized protein n=1 Tax=Catellatospora bangladeshensis TaxID=310355 RepID=A0A8J3JRI7_9ACTN|nr:hypothetical protein [Catellatospora bangladeshensis]GIF85612.1 hypothetical protein Cba03nite_69610 [Catellatospora bangladeshensis]
MSDVPAPSDVLDAYQGLPIRLDASTLDLSGDLIACGDEALFETVRQLGDDLGRPVARVSTADGRLPDGSEPSSVLLFALRHGFSAELARRWVDSSLRSGIPLGLVLVDDVADARFQASKLRLAHTRILPGDDGVIDSIGGFCGKSDDLAAARPERLSSVLASPWRMLGIVGHSDLGHMGLGSHLICGATGPEQSAGRPLADGCDPDRGVCRCMTQYLRTAVPAASLRAAVVALMGCMTFDAATNEFSSTNSLCASALRGRPVAVIAMLGDLDPRFDAVGQCARSLAEGLSLGAAVQRLNRGHQIPTGYGFALVGDPALRFAPGAPAAAEVTPAGAADCGDLAAPLLDRCREALGHGRRADRIRRVLLKVSDRSLNDELEDALEALDRAREQVDDAAWSAVELLHENVDHRIWQDPGRLMTRLDKAIGRWDEAFAAAAALVPGNDMYLALHAFHRLDSHGLEGSCPRCGSELGVFRYTDPELAHWQRIAAKCWQCGPIREAAQSGPDLSIAVSGTYEPGASMRPRLTARAAPEWQDRAGHLVVVLHDRLTEEVLSTFQAECTLAELPDIVLETAAKGRSDLQIVWAVWVSGMTVSFTATRVPVTRTIY